MMIPRNKRNLQGKTVPTFVESVYLDSEIGIPTELESAGTCLENAFA